MRRFSLIVPFLLSLIPATASAQDAINTFLDHVLEASQLKSCAETEKALNKIPEAEFDAALNDLKSLKDSASLEQITAKFTQIQSLTAQCPRIQDKFANRLSRFTVHAAINDREEHLKTIHEFTTWVYDAAQENDCTKAAKKLAQFPNNICKRVLVSYQTIEPSSLPDEEYNDIFEKSKAVLAKNDTCHAFYKEMQNCLVPVDPNYLSIDVYDPIFDYLTALRNALESTACNQIQSIKIDEKMRKAAAEAAKGITPDRIAPEHRKHFRRFMTQLFRIDKKCPEAKDFINKAVDQLDM